MTSTRGATLLKVIMGLTLIVMGSVATLYLWGSWKRAEETRTWKPVEAIVIASQVLTDRPSPHSPLKFTADVHYRYTVDGKTHTSTRIKRVDGPSSHKNKTEEVVARYPLGKPVTCYVNPAQPDFAILEHDSRAALYSIWFPLLFVAGGAGMVVSALRGKPAPVATA
jgi:hypothetical protein